MSASPALARRALTVDVEGCFRLWAIERSVGSRALVVGLFDAHSVTSTIRPKSIAIVWDLALITSSNGLSLLESQRTQRQGAALAVRFCEERSEIFIMMAKSALVVDAITGRTKKQLALILDGDISVCHIDKAVNKINIGDTLGGVGVHRTANLNRIADTMANSHNAEVTGLVVDDVSNLVITISMDREIHIYEGELAADCFSDDGMKMHRTNLLRRVTNAHDKEITTVAFSHRWVPCAPSCQLRLPV